MIDLEHDEQSPQPDVHLCRTCGGKIVDDATTFPFCSDRCRSVDLGKWFDGDYKISREIKDSDLETVD